MKIVIFAAMLALGFACTGPSRVDEAANLAPASPQTSRNAAHVPTPKPEDGAPRISLADAKKEFDAHSAVFIDTRSAEQYAQGHIPGAINLSYTDIAAGKDDKIPKGKKIIAYCS